MTFCTEEQKEEETIKEVKIKGNIISIDYLNGTSSEFFNNRIDFIDDLEEKMIKQAKEREKNYKEYKLDSLKSFIIGTASSILFTVSCDKDVPLIIVLSIIISCTGYMRCIRRLKEIEELKKYKILLENYKQFKESEDITKIIECDSYYRDKENKYVNIFTIDNYSLSDIKLMKKELKKSNK